MTTHKGTQARFCFEWCFAIYHFHLRMGALASDINITIGGMIQIVQFYRLSVPASQAIFRRPSRLPKRSSNVSVDAPSNLPSVQSAHSNFFRWPSGRWERVFRWLGQREERITQLGTSARSSFDPVGAAQGSFADPVGSQKNLPRSELAPQTILRILKLLIIF